MVAGKQYLITYLLEIFGYVCNRKLEMEIVHRAYLSCRVLDQTHPPRLMCPQAKKRTLISDSKNFLDYPRKKLINSYTEDKKGLLVIDWVGRYYGFLRKLSPMCISSPQNLRHLLKFYWASIAINRIDQVILQ